MPSLLTGISIVTHLIICFVYKTTVFFRGLLFGFKKNSDSDLTMLIRSRDETFLPAFVIGFVSLLIASIAIISVATSFRSRPNTFDLIENMLAETPATETISHGTFIVAR